MNGPLPDTLRRALHAPTLDDRYTLEQGVVFMSGTQALVRLPMLQRTRDLAAGLNTAGFISGYRGSPLGGYDQALWKARAHLQAHQIVFQPGVNEELAATAVWGTQQLDLYPDERRYDGVFGLWYGKGPGVDRSVDVFKHACMAGTARHGGVVAVAGDDHAARSSSVAHQSDHVFKACGMPVFFPASVQEILDLGLHAFALSRYAGLWSALKTVQEVVESSTRVSVEADRVRIVLPQDFTMPADGLHIRWPDTPLEQEARLMDHKWYAALAYIRANRLNRTVIDSRRARLGLIASGKAYNDTRQALHDLGLDEATCAAVGIRLHKVAVVWPLEATTTREFARGLQEILVIEEKRQVIEYQLKEELYNWREDVRPNVLGKFDEAEGDATGGEWSRPDPAAAWLLRAQADLNPALIARALAKRLARLGLLDELDADHRAQFAARLAVIDAKLRGPHPAPGPAPARADLPARTPWFCSGCPHNTSTRVPEGSRALAGIGCHYMVTWMERRTQTVSQMGGEGVAWIGQAPFSRARHVFVNLGDGTYFHSGLLAIRQALAARVNVTYKILFNDAVAMTGGQPIDGSLGVPALTRELHAEGVRHLAIVSDEPARYAPSIDQALGELDPALALAPGTRVYPRSQLDAVQRELREVPGCSVLIYDQTCATEKRRRRKRGALPPVGTRLVINERVCEGCGDCAVQSNCLSLEPVDTPWGRKRRIATGSCNHDATCLDGRCPSFVSVQGQPLPAAQRSAPRLADLPPAPAPARRDLDAPWGMVVAGIGGTGVITLGQLIGMAAHLDGSSVLTQDCAGLAQKGGATWSHVQVAPPGVPIHTTRVATAECDLLLAADALVAAQPATLDLLHADRSHVLLNTHAAPTAAALSDPDWAYPSARCEQALAAGSRSGRLLRLDAHRLALELLGDDLYANPLLLGAAWQQGWVPVSREALHRAIELNGVQVQANQEAFEWGRLAAVDLAAVERLASCTTEQPIRILRPAAREDLDAWLARYHADLIAYQDAAYAGRYLAFVEQVRRAEATAGTGTRLTTAVARNLYKLMAYKDEYEVARLLTDPDFEAGLARQYAPGFRLSYHLAPPALPGAAKRHFGPWLRPLLGLLARLKPLRGSWLDPFGYHAERRAERAAIADYRAALSALLPQVAAGDATSCARALELARLPEQVRGYGAVKRPALEAMRQQLQAACRTTAAPQPLHPAPPTP